jgi:hypothetical protein
LQVIKDSFRGKTREEIATQNSTSTGNVSYILMDFRKKIGESAVDETIEFARMVRQSGITMDQCLEGYRMYTLMEKVGFNTDNDNMDENKEFQDFVNKIYYPCKNIDIPPYWIFKWIKDMLSVAVKLKNIRPLAYIYDDNFSTKNDLSSFEDSSEIYHQPYTDRNRLKDDNQLPLVDCKTAIDTDLSRINDTQQPFQSTYCVQPYSFPSRLKGLLLSDIVTLISQVQGDANVIYNYHQKINKETIKLQNNFAKVRDSLQKAKIKNEKILHFESWFYKAKDLLWNLYGIRIETDLSKFIKVMNEFNKHNHDPYEIIYEYMYNQSLDKEIVEKEKKIDGLKNQIKILEIQSSSTRACLEYNKNMENTIEQFESINFGIDDLMRIHNLIVESASINNIPVQSMIKIVVDDMEKNYYNHTLFADLVNKKKAEYRELIKQYSYDEKSYEENYFFKVSVFQLFNLGISQQNIIDINLLISELEKRNFYSKNIQDLDPDKKTDIRAINMSNNYKALINDLRKYVTLSIACQEKLHELNEIKKQRMHLMDGEQSRMFQKEKTFSCLFVTNYRIPYSLF